MTTRLHTVKHSPKNRNALIEKAVSVGFNRAVVPALLDFLIDELAEAPEVIQTRELVNGRIVMNIHLREVRVNGEVIPLSRIEFNLLEYFMRRVGVVIPSETILTNVWGKHCKEQAQYLRVYVSELRKKLGADTIQNRFRQGYFMPMLG